MDAPVLGLFTADGYSIVTTRKQPRCHAASKPQISNRSTMKPKFAWSHLKINFSSKSQIATSAASLRQQNDTYLVLQPVIFFIHQESRNRIASLLSCDKMALLLIICQMMVTGEEASAVSNSLIRSLRQLGDKHVVNFLRTLIENRILYFGWHNSFERVDT